MFVLINRRGEVSVLIAFVSGYLLCYLVISGSHWSSTKTRHFFLPETPHHHYVEEGSDAEIDLTAINWTNQEHSHENEDTAAADVLANSVRVLCLVLTTEKYHKSRAVHVKQTWGRRCSKLIFASDVNDDVLGSVAVSNESTYNTVWGKVKNVFRLAYTRYLNDYDWFLKCDDDTYVVMENLRLILSAYSPNQPLWMGRLFKKFTPQGYMSGGAGYVLSRKAVEKFFTESLRTPRVCKINDDTGAEDAEMGKCLYGVGVTVADSRDPEGRQRFFPFDVASHLLENYSSGHWIWDYDYYKLQMGPACCSDTAAAFHYIKPNDMYVLEYTIYHLKPFGVGQIFETELIKDTLLRNNYKVAENPGDEKKRPIHAVHWPLPKSIQRQTNAPENKNQP